MESIVMKAYAKVNLTLDVLRRREDGYHDVQMIMQQIDLHDEIILKVLKEGIRVHSGHSYVPDDDSNIAVKAAKVFFAETGVKGGVDIVIRKRIPVAAGLAGGSTDAAAVIVGLDTLYETRLSQERLLALGAAIGADVPFCMLGGTCLSEGTGTALTALRSEARYWLLLVKPPVGVSTREVYEGLSVADIRRHPDTESAILALREGNIYHLKDAMYNVLEEVTSNRLKVIGEIEAKLMSCGAKKAMMSGSGPTVFGLFTRGDRAEKALKHMKKYYQEVFLVRPILGGVKHAK